MSNITKNGAPDKNTAGAVGDLYTNTITGNIYECVCVYEIISGDEIRYEYDWVLINTEITDDEIAETINYTKTNVEKLVKKEIISVQDYGAVGDKVNDDTQAIKDALKNGRYVTAKGEKHYIITDTIVIPQHATLDFNNAYVTFMGENACFQLKQASAIKNVRINISAGLLLTKSAIYIDGNDIFHVGHSTTPNIEGVSIEQHANGEEDIAYRNNIGIWLNANQQTPNTSCCISGVLVEKIKAKLLKHVIYLSVKDAVDNTGSVYISSNTFRDILAYNCKCFIKDEILEDSSTNASVGSNIYDNLHLQPHDGMETCYMDVCGSGNSFVNPIFWDNDRPSNKTDQIIIRGDYNYISGVMAPSITTDYVNNMGSYNFYQGSTYGAPAQYFGGNYVSERGYQKKWRGMSLRTEHIYHTQISSINSGTIEGSNDVESMFMPLTYGDLAQGYTCIRFKSIGTCDETTQVRRFWLGLHDSNYICGGSLAEGYAAGYDCDCLFAIRKYDTYAEVLMHIKVVIKDSIIMNKVYSEKKYNITNDMIINPRLRLGSTNAGGITQIYQEIRMIFHE